MAVPSLIPGYKYTLARGDGASPENFIFLCTVTTRGLDMTNNFDDAELQDCDSISALPVRVSTPKSKNWSISFSGKADASRFQSLYQDQVQIQKNNYQLGINLSGAQGGGNWQGQAYPETLKVESNENGLVTFSGTLRGQGDYPTWTANP
ncbi:phage tail tube protein [Methylocella silvestris]|uniref:Phage tail protein n=1 Tax=Methylocella silvestris TaxID=199596 RepID=A0A2J7TJQ9_METSI|nr:phage tail tube protein [Methylocella silvestris]PNG27004.1 hypothetical protein CR492_04690 [Methylocella silvestris]